MLFLQIRAAKKAGFPQRCPEQVHVIENPTGFLHRKITAQRQRGEKRLTCIHTYTYVFVIVYVHICTLLPTSGDPLARALDLESILGFPK